MPMPRISACAASFGRGTLDSSSVRLPASRSRARQSTACGNAFTPSWMTPQRSRMKPSNRSASGAKPGRCSIAAILPDVAHRCPPRPAPGETAGAQRGGEFALQPRDQRRAGVGEGGVELHQRRAGADLGQRLLAGGHAADADQHEPAARQQEGARQHAWWRAGTAARRTGRRPRAPAASAGPAGREIVVFDTISPCTPSATQVSTTAASASSREVGGDLHQHRRAVRHALAPTARRIARSCASPCRSRSPGVFGEETLITT